MLGSGIEVGNGGGQMDISNAPEERDFLVLTEKKGKDLAWWACGPVYFFWKGSALGHLQGLSDSRTWEKLAQPRAEALGLTGCCD